MATLIGTQQVARILRVDRSTVHRWVLDGRLVPALVVPLRMPADDDTTPAEDGPKAYLFDADDIAQLNPFRVRRRAAVDDTEPLTGTD